MLSHRMDKFAAAASELRDFVADNLLGGECGFDTSMPAGRSIAFAAAGLSRRGRFCRAGRGGGFRWLLVGPFRKKAKEDYQQRASQHEPDQVRRARTFARPAVRRLGRLHVECGVLSFTTMTP